MNELWRNLRIGDRVRVVSWPLGLDQNLMSEELRDLYMWLIATQQTLTITKIDHIGLPWGEIIIVLDGEEHVHQFALDHGGLEVVSRT